MQEYLVRFIRYFSLSYRQIKRPDEPLQPSPSQPKQETSGQMDDTTNNSPVKGLCLFLVVISQSVLFSAVSVSGEAFSSALFVPLVSLQHTFPAC